MNNNILRSDLSHPPDIHIERLEDESNTTFNEGGFLALERCRIRFHYPDETSADAETNRLFGKRSDAVVIILYQHVPSINDHILYLRSSVRPAVSLRDYTEFGLHDSHANGCFWEIPAGLVEADELGVAGLKAAAKREGMEEVGFDLPEESFSFLGKRIFTCVGFAGERIFFLMAKVDWHDRVDPQGDGSPYERGGEVAAVPLKAALKAIDDGYLPDGKTQTAVLRLAKHLGVAC